ncbi:NAD(P)H-dependent oxidoreductase [Caloramator sp. E03]|uniref:NAD(P)H-dependent oxidoreductase n=1 Tax=Caloramator sp. E03 TaxID=2576307 RepID=UPI00111044DD|nr:NAD(P)H-dependent oxidoreductase [Caloramator sp. E03]QCX32997.1 NAD(P)H-dependent oxidoreductase [Caloramator sp. E03]
MKAVILFGSPRENGNTKVLTQSFLNGLIDAKCIVEFIDVTNDEAEIDAAKEYANENYNDENGEDEWNEEYYLPYLMDIATDNIRDIVDEICEEFGLIGEFVAYEMDKNSSSRCEFVVVFAKEGIEFDIDDIMEELDL